MDAPTRERAEPALGGIAPSDAPQRRFARGPEAIVEPTTGHQVVERRDSLYRRLLATADVAALAVALLAAMAHAGGARLSPWSLLALPIVVALSKLHGLYDRDELLIRKTTMDEAPQLFQLATLSTLLLWLADEAVLSQPLNGTEIVSFWAVLFAGSLVARRTARACARRASETERCLFVGDATSYERLRSKIEDAHINAQLVGRMSLQRVAPAGRRRATDGELRELVEWTQAHRVIVEPQTLPAEDMLDFVRAAKSVGVRVSLLPRVLDVVGTSVVFDDLHGMTVMGVRRFGLTRSSRFVKRSFDVTGAFVALVVAAPIMAILALAVRLDSGGPVLFRQTRVGRNDRHFRICKFRTMCSDAEQRKDELRAVNEARGGLFKIEEDPRITRVGRLLRKTALDELPQLINVLRGDMSLVGPRPLVVDEDAQIKGWDRRRLQLTPGMTGPWQILGSSRVPLPEMVKIDYVYVASWSLWQDLKILLRTVPYVLARRGM